MFGKKKQKEEILYTDYTNWDKDLGFLTLLMTRKKNITKNYLITVYATQLKDTDYIRDEDLEPVIVKSVQELMSELAKSYKTFLITKYFGNENELVKFLTEDFYVELTNAAIVQNAEKIKNNAAKKRAAEVGRMNVRNQENQNKEE